ncbi:MAG: hypothetical protein AB7E45_07110 [Candidatus Caldatribacteriota bacterium]
MKEKKGENKRRFRTMNAKTLNKVIEDFSHLPLDDKEYTVEIIRKQLIEAKRVAISKRAKEAMVNFRKGNSKIGDIKELYRDLESD